jgi:type IX secretion system PorP/SprF family membrane protein
MKKILVLIILVANIVLAQAQSNIRLTNYWNNTYYINPASIDDKYQADFSMAARKQWFNFPGAPTTFFAAATLYNEDLHAQFGLRATQDNVGYTTTSDIDFTYAYELTVARYWKLNMGVAATYQNMSYDLSQVNFSTPDDDKIFSHLINENNFNAEIGVELTNNHWRIGASSVNLFSLFYKLNKQYANTNFVYAMYKQNSRNYINLGYGICGIQYANTYQMELNMTSYFNLPGTNAFQVGLLYRTWSEMGLLFGIDLSKNLKLSYSYDYNVGGISRSSLGTNELMITYKLDKIWKCRNCWY